MKEPRKIDPGLTFCLFREDEEEQLIFLSQYYTIIYNYFGKVRKIGGKHDLYGIDQKAAQAAEDDSLLNDFIRQNETFILQCASLATHRYVTRSDDEWSVALLAFSQAVGEYSEGKGSFPGFARLVIRRKLIDYMRAQSKYRAESDVSLSLLDSGPEEDQEGSSAEKAVLRQIAQAPDDSLKLEIESANDVFSGYGFSFYDLTSCSPKAEKTKRACARAVAYIIRTPVLLSDLKNSKCLPLKIIEKNCRVPRKILERHRKYIIAAVEIMTGDYPFLAGYMRFVREELDK